MSITSHIPPRSVYIAREVCYKSAERGRHLLLVEDGTTVQVVVHDGVFVQMDSDGEKYTFRFSTPDPVEIGKIVATTWGYLNKELAYA